MFKLSEQIFMNLGADAMLLNAPLSLSFFPRSSTIIIIIIITLLQCKFLSWV
jgi:hypothetical protein